VHHPITESVTTVRVNYSETDQMGVVYHARHVVWLDIARTEHLRQVGFSYRDLEAQGVRLVVTDLRLRYLAAARYDDVVRIRCRVREARPRRVIFSYSLELADGAVPIAEGETTLMCLDQAHRLSRLPHSVLAALQPGGADAGRPSR
jgi:acyl-CoA thioester hydrolase